jgi:hypothetical protein
MNEVLSESDIRSITAALQTPAGRATVAQTMLEPRSNVDGLVKPDCMLETLYFVDTSNSENATIPSSNQQVTLKEETPETERQATKVEDTVQSSSHNEVAINVQKGLDNLGPCKTSALAGTSQYTSSTSNSENLEGRDNQQERCETIKCQLCGFVGIHLAVHISRKHGVPCKEYKKMVPGVIITADTWKDKYKDAMIKSCGVTSPLKNKAIKEKQQLKAEATSLTRYGVTNVFHDPTLQKEYHTKARAATLKKYGVDNVWKLPCVQEKIRKSRECTPNKIESVASEVMPSVVKYMGGGDFWIRTRLGPKNPDFVVTPFSETKKVIEIFGGIGVWHSKEEALDVICAYKEVGVYCLVITDNCFYQSVRCQKTVHVIEHFINTSSSETFPDELYISYDKVRSLPRRKDLKVTSYAG